MTEIVAAFGVARSTRAPGGMGMRKGDNLWAKHLKATRVRSEHHLSKNYTKSGHDFCHGASPYMARLAWS
jgi:hypothetical protein